MAFRHVREQIIEALIDPSDSENEEMVEPVLTPAHSDALKALLD